MSETKAANFALIGAVDACQHDENVAKAIIHGEEIVTTFDVNYEPYADTNVYWVVSKSSNYTATEWVRTRSDMPDSLVIHILNLLARETSSRVLRHDH